ncbi:MAG TPA: PEP/pyruvate-binding domain-containing protein [Candidatus Methylomirabilis sp.]
MNPLVLSYGDAATAGPAVVGGKGWSLGRLHRYGFPVPPGGVLAAAVYTQLMAAPAVRALAAEAGRLRADDTVTPEGSRALAALREGIEATSLPSGVADGVSAFLREAALAEAPIAIRSSATAEDGAKASFAGVHRSVLGVLGVDAALRAIRTCFASLWTREAVAYRRRMGIPDDAVACAAVLCRMIGGPHGGRPPAAGVAFSCDPRTGRRDRIIINVAPGLGEAVVGGRVNPEEITVSIHGRRLLVSGRVGREEHTPADAWAAQLARLVLRIQWALGDGQDPQDVEWAYDGRQFWILQARPVTRAPRITFPGTTHLPVIWSNGNLKDAVPGVPTTLTWDTIQGVIREMLYTATESAGYGGLEGGEPVRRIRGRAYFDLTDLQWAFYDAFGYPPRLFNRELGGHQPEIPLPPGNPFRSPGGVRRVRARLRLMRALWRHARTYPADTARIRSEARSLRAIPLEPLRDAELVERLDEQTETARCFAREFQLGNALMWDNLLIGLLERYRPGRGRALAAGLMAGSGRVVSAEHGYGLFELAAAAAADPEARAYLERRPLDPQGWRRLSPQSAFRSALAMFLEEYGHRSVYEAEMANPRWREDPSFLLEQVRLDLAEGRTQVERGAARATHQQAETEVRQLPLWARPAVRWLAANARAAAARREAGKSALAALYEPTRSLALEIGRRLAARGALDAATDVFHLAWVELQAFLLGEWDGWSARTLVGDRVAQREAWFAGEARDYYILDAEGRPAVLPIVTPAVTGSVPLPDDLRARRGRHLAGVGAAAGRCAGRARIIRHPEAGYRLERGEILIAPSTDPGWTPLFLRAAGVVMEMGGYLSHGAIVAREYGIPAVVNVPGLLDLVRDGQSLIVDGTSGWVVVEDEG